MKRLAVFVDFENLRNVVYLRGVVKHLFDLSQKKEVRRIVLEDVPLTAALFLNDILSIVEDDEEIFRIYFYTARPFSGKWNDKDYSKSPFTQIMNAFINEIGKRELVQLRLGEIKVFREKDGSPRFSQKGVDLLLGLDIAMVSYEKLCDRVAVFSYDTDIIPALKFARERGVQTVFPMPKDYRHADVFLENCDFVRSFDPTSELMGVPFE